MQAETERRVSALVTGGAGFIGSHLVERLLANGYHVVCVDNFILGKREHLREALKNPACSLHELDILQKNKLDDLFGRERFDIVFHLAANSDIREGTTSTDRDLQLTFLTTYNVLECMRQHGVGRILFTSTPAIFGRHDEPLKEDSSVSPESLYGASKLASEAFIMAFSRLYIIQTWICRLSNIVGERSTHGIIFDLLNKLATNPSKLEVLGDGTQCKPYMYVHELIDALLFIVEHSDQQINIFNIGPRDCTTVSDIARIVLEETGGRQTIAYAGGKQGWRGDVSLYRYDASKLETLGWTPRMTSTNAVRTATKRMIQPR